MTATRIVAHSGKVLEIKDEVGAKVVLKDRSEVCIIGIFHFRPGKKKFLNSRGPAVSVCWKNEKKIL